MTETPQSKTTGQFSATSSEPSIVPRASTWLVWTLFLLSLGVLSFAVWSGHEWTLPGAFVVDGLTALVWTVVTFFSGIVHSYSRRYMAGDQHLDQFYGRVLGFTLVVMTMTAANHVALFAAAWLAMGLLMASLIGHRRDWKQARAASKMARRYFLASSTTLAVGLSILAWTTGTATISGILGSLGSVPRTVGLVAIGMLVVAAMLQSALFPFHTWLLSSMTAPTPASALMHAGFVNAGGILLTRFAPLFAQETIVMSAIVAIGAFSALLGQALLLVQPDVKRKLGASTVAQMGFMILQCGLGFFAAAITHLILHGFYKAYLFLSAGAGVEQTTPDRPADTTLTLPRLAISLVTALGGGALFAFLTGKGTSLNSGVFLVLIVVLTTLHATRDILRRPTLTPFVRTVSVPLVAMVAIGIYGVLFNAISTVMAGVPMTTSPTDVTWVHVGVAAAFIAAYLSTELGWHRDSKRLYVTLMNLSQPDPTTVLTRKEEYDDA